MFSFIVVVGFGLTSIKSLSGGSIPCLSLIMSSTFLVLRLVYHFPLLLLFMQFFLSIYSLNIYLTKLKPFNCIICLKSNLLQKNAIFNKNLWNFKVLIAFFIPSNIAPIFIPKIQKYSPANDLLNPS